MKFLGRQPHVTSVILLSPPLRGRGIISLWDFYFVLLGKCVIIKNSNRDVVGASQPVISDVRGDKKYLQPVVGGW